MGKKRNAYRILAGKRSLGRPRSRWEKDIEMDHGDIGWSCMDWTDVA
jgi:hypothetical protein